MHIGKTEAKEAIRKKYLRAIGGKKSRQKKYKTDIVIMMRKKSNDYQAVILKNFTFPI